MGSRASIGDGGESEASDKNDESVGEVAGSKHLTAQQKDQVYHQCIEMFMDVLEPNVIHDVILQKNYDFYGALEDLMMLSNNVKTIEEQETEANQNLSHSTPTIGASDVGVKKYDKDVNIEDKNEFMFSKHDMKSNGAVESNSATEVIFGSNSKSLHSIWSESTEKTSSPTVNDEKMDESELHHIVEQYHLIKKIPNTFDRITSLINENLKLMIILRGCSGSGKSYLALTIMKKTSIQPGKYKDHIFSTDDFFKLGKEYVFNPEKLSDAHNWNQKRVLAALRENRSPVIIDNTNTQIWEMRPYAAMAVAEGYDLEILEPETWWCFHENELSKRNVHGVPKKSIRNMLDRYEKNINVETLLRYCGIQYSKMNEPPQLVKLANSAKKRGGRRANKNKKPEASLSEGLPSQPNTTPTPELPTNLFSFGINPDTDVFKNLCSYYKSLNFDNSLNECEKTDTKETDSRNTDNDSVGSSHSLSDAAYGFTLVEACHKKQPFSNNDNNATRSLIDFNYQSTNERETIVSNSDSPLKIMKDQQNPIESENCNVTSSSSMLENIDSTSIGAENIDYPKTIKSLLNGLKNNIISQEKSDVISNRTSKIKNKDLDPLFSSSENDTLNKEVDSTNDNSNVDNQANENTCRQFIMYSEKGVFYSDPICAKFPNLKSVLVDQPIDNSVMQPKDNNSIRSNEFASDNPASTENSKITEMNVELPSTNYDQSNIIEEFDGLLTKCNVDTEGADVGKIENSEKNISESNNCQLISESTTNNCCIPVVKEKLPEIDLMSLILKNKTSEPVKDTNVNVDVLPKPERFNLQEMKSTNIFKYPIPTEDIRPEVALWDTVNDPMPLWQNSEKPKDNKLQTNNEPKPQREVLNKTCTVDSSTNTVYADFDIVRNEFGEKILFGRSRSICEDIIVGPNEIKSGKLLLDKGTMADAADESKIGFDELASLFPQLHGGALVELVEKCQGDLNWAVDLLLDSGSVSLPDDYQSKTSNISPVQMDKSQELNKVNLNFTGARRKTPKFDKKQTLKESKLELKELIEKSIVLNESHYSDHVLKIMKRRRDGYKKEEGQQIKKSDANSDDNNLNVKDEETSRKEDLFRLIDTEAQVAEENEGEVDNEEGEEEQVQLAVSKDFIVQLQQKFGCSLSPNTLENSYVIDLPVSLACQLYSYVLDSLQRETDHQQDLIDAMIKEDEEFARQLQQQENSIEVTEEKKPPMLQEIMDMEMALEFYKANQNELMHQNQNTMASKLSMQILTQTFPSIDKTVLTDLFHAHNCSLHDTVASLNLVLFEDQPSLQEREEQLFSKLESVKSQEISEDRAIILRESESCNYPRQDALDEAENYRRQASCCYQMRTDCFMKAQDAFRSNNTSAASYYSQLAVLHKRRAEFYNSQAAACLFHARARSSTLDLHFLRVVEAVQVLDIFLDEEIMQLKQNKKKKAVVYLITGRGLRSVGGVSRIKPIVQRRLRERKIIYNEVNPGMLNAILTRNTQLTNDI